MSHSTEPVLDLVAQLVRFPSVSHESNSDVSQAVADALSRIGFDVEWLSYTDELGKTKVSLVAKRGSGVGGVAYLAHTDVVPVDDWSADFCGPFDAVVRDGRIYGRGTCDMKGSLAAAITAASQLAPSATSPTYFVVTSDEEVGMHGARLIDSKSRYFEEMVANSTVGIIGEPTHLQVVHAHKGGMRFQVVARGISAHTSTNDGVNANYKLIPALSGMLQLREETETNSRYQHAMFDPPTLSWNMTLSNEPNAMNVTPSLAKLNNFIRLMPDVDVEPLLEQVAALCNAHGLELMRRDAILPWGVAKDSEWIQTMLRITGETESRSVCYATDAAVLQRLERMLVCGPGHIDQAHRSDEWISIEQLHKGVETYRRAFQEFS